MSPFSELVGGSGHTGRRSPPPDAAVPGPLTGPVGVGSLGCGLVSSTYPTRADGFLDGLRAGGCGWGGVVLVAFFGGARTVVGAGGNGCWCDLEVFRGFFGLGCWSSRLAGAATVG